MAEIQEVVEKSLNVTKNPKLKKFMPFAIAGGILGLGMFIYKKRNGSQDNSSQSIIDDTTGKIAPFTPESTTTSDNGQSSASLISALSEYDISNKIAISDLKGYIDQTNATIGQQVGTLQTQLTQANGQVDTLKTQLEISKQNLTDSLNQTRDYVANKVGSVQTVTSSPVVNSVSSAQVNYVQSSAGYGNNGVGTPTKSIQEIKSNTQSYINEVARTEAVYSNRVSAGLDTTAQVNYSKQLQTNAPVNLGNNGIGYNAETSNKFEASLKTDQSAYNKEIARVNEVIANRTAAGLDTTAQTNYLNKIKQ